MRNSILIKLIVRVMSESDTDSFQLGRDGFDSNGERYNKEEVRAKANLPVWSGLGPKSSPLGQLTQGCQEDNES